MAVPYPNAPGVAFKDIPDFPGYCVGDDGSVWSCRLNSGRVVPGVWHALRATGSHNGYLVVTLCRPGPNCRRFVHRLIAEAFIGPCPTARHQINHVDGNKANNRPKNLEWVTSAENHAHASRTGLKAYGQRNANAKLTNEAAREILSLKGREPQRVTAKRFGVDQAIVGRIQRGVLWKHA